MNPHLSFRSERQLNQLPSLLRRQHSLTEHHGSGSELIHRNNFMAAILKNISLGGFRSFREIQRLRGLTKINLLIGKNNSGKSNILRFIHDILPKFNQSYINLNDLENHIRPDGTSTPFICGFGSALYDEAGDVVFPDHIKAKLREDRHEILKKILAHCATENGDGLVWYDFIGPGKQFNTEPWDKAVRSIAPHELSHLWQNLNGMTGGSLDQHWAPQTIEALKPPFPTIVTVMIPAIRKIGGKGTTSDDFSGDGIIERLVRLQNPDVQNQRDREKFDKINHFLRYVTENESATIEIPHDRSTINVHMDGLVFPLESMGTGIHDVIILATAATILQDSLICMEEPEIHLNPLLQKKLIRYLYYETSNQYFIATHSAALMDAEHTSIYHIYTSNGKSTISQAISSSNKSVVCDDLGYKPSDLLQTNCLIWVEGPSDRIYVKHWINLAEPKLTEGIDYSIMFYGCRLASHISGLDPTEIVDEFISLRRMNRRAVILIDSDKRFPQTPLNATKVRLIEEFNKGPGFAWVTAGRAVENYIPPGILRGAIRQASPSAESTSNFDRYADGMTIKTKKGEVATAPKVAVAKYVTENPSLNLDCLDLDVEIKKLIKFIHESND